jgi:menaquinone-9 beta-reductase
MRADLDTELLVVGAGPAGSAAAITGAGLGVRVTLVDKAVFPRDKTCGDALTVAALRLLERLGLELEALPTYESVRATIVVSPSGRQIVLPLPDDGQYAGVVPREELDAALLDVARRAGAEVREGAALTGLVERDDGVTAELADGSTVRARWVVAADGHYSKVRRLVQPGSGPSFGEATAFRQYFRGVDDRRTWVLFEEDLLPGYAWVFPLPGGRANVGFGMERGRGVNGRTLNAKWRELLERPSLRAVLGDHAQPEQPHRAWPIPTDGRKVELAVGHALFTGDAAAVVDPMTGEGIAQALETGVLAASAVAAGGSADAVRKRYRKSVLRALRTDARVAHWLQHGLRTRFRVRAALHLVRLTPWTRRTFARWMWEDFPRALVFTPRRWRRRMFRRSGAYRAVS